MEGRKEGKERGDDGGEAKQEEWTLPMASRSLCQMPPDRAAPALRPREGQAGPASVVS